jgi:hypothetical protein
MNPDTYPEEMVLIPGAGRNEAISRNRPRAVVEVGISPAQLAVLVIAEVVAGSRDLVKRLGETQHLRRECEQNCEKDP